MTAEDRPNIPNLFECSIEACVDRGAGDGVVSDPEDVLLIPHKHILRQRDVEKGVAWQYFATVFLDHLPAFVFVPIHLIWINAAPAFHTLAIVDH